MSSFLKRGKKKKSVQGQSLPPLPNEQDYDDDGSVSLPPPPPVFSDLPPPPPPSMDTIPSDLPPPPPPLRSLPSLSGSPCVPPKVPSSLPPPSSSQPPAPPPPATIPGSNGTARQMGVPPPPPPAPPARPFPEGGELRRQKSAPKPPERRSSMKKIAPMAMPGLMDIQSARSNLKKKTSSVKIERDNSQFQNASDSETRSDIFPNRALKSTVSNKGDSTSVNSKPPVLPSKSNTLDKDIVISPASPPEKKFGAHITKSQHSLQTAKPQPPPPTAKPQPPRPTAKPQPPPQNMKPPTPTPSARTVSLNPVMIAPTPDSVLKPRTGVKLPPKSAESDDRPAPRPQNNDVRKDVKIIPTKSSKQSWTGNSDFTKSLDFICVDSMSTPTAADWDEVQNNFLQLLEELDSIDTGTAPTEGQYYTLELNPTNHVSLLSGVDFSKFDEEFSST